ITREKIHALVNSPGPSYLFVPQAIAAEQNKIPYLAGFGPVEAWAPTRNAASPKWNYIWGFGFALVTPAPPGDFRAGKPGYTLADAWGGFMGEFGPRTNKKMAMFAADDQDGRGWFAGNPPVLKKMGYDVIGTDKKLGLFPGGTTYFAPMIKQWKANNCEILWGMAPGPDFGTMWREARTMGWVPKIAMVAKAPLFFEEVSAWGGDLPMGVGTERWWDTAYPAESCPGIGGTTPQSLFERWYKKTGKALNQGIGWGYVPIQVLANAIERAGTLDATAISKAIGETDMLTISHRVVFTKEDHHCRLPLTFGQWMKVDKPWKWECPIVVSNHEFLKPTAQAVFPIPK
ncbi:MAG: ABC transporter substrate-binding protein, partial [Deltaproteobacteria bacterium]|nr:ABC transporter substrate-binding protein [Deltaproteobacteria bacterium]